jgi:hypothetical protein
MKAATKHMAKRKITKAPKQQAMPVNDTPSNAKGDNMALGLFFALMIASATTLLSGVYISSSRFVQAINSTPIDYGTAFTMTLLLTVTFIVARSLFWLAFFGPVMLASKIGAWNTCESLSRRAIRLPKSLSRGSSWAAVALVQSLVGRGRFREAIDLAGEEWARSGEDAKQVQNLGPLCVAVGIAAQVENDMKESLQWNERAISCLTQSYDDLQKPKSGVFAKAMGTQSVEWLGQVTTQLAVAFFKKSTKYFKNQDHRRAKQKINK